MAEKFELIRQANWRCLAKKLKAGGVTCPFGSAWPSWVLIENMHAYHDQPFTDRRNGFDGLASALKINSPFGVKLMELLARGAKEGWFTYAGRLNKAEALMTAGECGSSRPPPATSGISPATRRGSSRGEPGSYRGSRASRRELDIRWRLALGHEGRRAKGVTGASRSS